MRLFLHPNEREELPVEIILSADEAERWIAQLQSGVRNVREGRGEQLFLMGEPARLVLTVQERTDTETGDRPRRAFRPTPGPARPQDLLAAMSRAVFVIVLALLVIALFLMGAYRILP